MSRIIKVLDKYTETGGNITIKKDASELKKWYELEEILYEANKQSGRDWEKWVEITGRRRGFGCFISEVENAIKNLGGKIFAERGGNDNGNQNLCKNCQSAIDSAKDWEVNYKRYITENCSGNNCGNRYSDGFSGSLKNVIHSKCWKIASKWRRNSIDEEVFDVNCGCENITEKELLEFTPQNALKSYFITNKVKRISKQLDELKIEYLDGRSKNIGSESEDKDYENIIEFMKEHNKTSLDRNELGITDERNYDPNFTPPSPPPAYQYLSTLQNVLDYITANNIKSIINKGDDLIITFNTNTNTNTISEKEISDDNSPLEPEQRNMWQKFKDYLNKTGKSTINKQELQQEIKNLKQTAEEKPTSKTPLIIGGVVIVAVLGIIATLIIVRKNKKSNGKP